jgi:hypothetical protein
MEWVRLYHDMPTDPRWRVIARKSGQRIGDVIAVWNFVLTNASANGADRGRVKDLSSEGVGAALDLEESDVLAILGAMEGRVIAGDRLIEWEARNPKKEDNSSQRTKDWRKRRRDDGDAPVTTGDGGVTPRDAPEKKTEEESEAAVARAREGNSNDLNRLNKVLGLDETNFTAHAANLRTLIDLKAQGCDFERHILPAAEQAARGGKARSLAYIRPRALEMRDAQRTVESIPPPFENTNEFGWRERLRAYAEKDMWSSKWGAKPGEPGCKCPENILAERSAAA